MQLLVAAQPLTHAPTEFPSPRKLLHWYEANMVVLVPATAGAAWSKDRKPGVPTSLWRAVGVWPLDHIIMVAGSQSEAGHHQGCMQECFYRILPARTAMCFTLRSH